MPNGWDRMIHEHGLVKSHAFGTFNRSWRAFALATALLASLGGTSAAPEGERRPTRHARSAYVWEFSAGPFYGRLAEGELIPWAEVQSAAAVLIFGYGGMLCLAGCLVLRRRELALPV